MSLFPWSTTLAVDPCGVGIGGDDPFPYSVFWSGLGLLHFLGTHPEIPVGVVLVALLMASRTGMVKQAAKRAAAGLAVSALLSALLSALFVFTTGAYLKDGATDSFVFGLVGVLPFVVLLIAVPWFLWLWRASTPVGGEMKQWVTPPAGGSGDTATGSAEASDTLRPCD